MSWSGLYSGSIKLNNAYCWRIFNNSLIFDILSDVEMEFVFVRPHVCRN
jgi:hypothetical protein